MIARLRRGAPVRLLVVAFLILLLAALIRGLGLAKGLPYTYYPDEPRYITIFQEMFKTGDWNPRFFYYPAFFFYLNAAAYVPYYLAGRAMGVFGAPAGIQPPQIVTLAVGYTPFPTTFLMARAITLLFGVAAVGLVIRLAWRLTRDGRAALLAGLLLAVSTTHVEYSRYTFPHAIFATMLLLAFWGCHLVYSRGRTRDYLLAAALCGLAVATMYHGAVILATLVAAHLLAPFEAKSPEAGPRGSLMQGGRLVLRKLRDPRLYGSLLLVGLVFLALNPFAFLVTDDFTRDSGFIIRHYLFAVGGTQAGGMGGALVYYLGYAWRVEGLLLLLAAIEVVRGLIKRHKPTLLIASFAVPYFVLISAATARNPRTFLPLIPFLVLLVAILFAELLCRVPALAVRLKAPRWTVSAVVILLCVPLVLPSTVATARATRDLLPPDSRETARAWIAENMPHGAKIALEWYSPYLDPGAFVLEPVFRLIDHPPEWYIANGFDYAIASQGVYRRFYDEPERHAAEIAQYEALFRALKPVHIFNDGGYEIRIYRVP